MSISTVELLYRIARRTRGGDYTKLSMGEQGDCLTAANTALQRLYNALPEYFKEKPEGFLLPGPLTVTGVGVTQYSQTVVGLNAGTAQFGQTIAFNNDTNWNQILGPNQLLNPYLGPTGTDGGTIYGDAIYSTTNPMDRIIGNPKFASQGFAALLPRSMAINNDMDVNFIYQQSVGRPVVWWPQVFGNSQGVTPLYVIKFAPVPDMAYAINIRLSFWPKRLLIADILANTVLNVPDQFIDTCLIPMALEEFTQSPAFVGTDQKDVRERGVAGELYARNQLGQLGSPSNKIFTPLGY